MGMVTALPLLLAFTLQAAAQDPPSEPKKVGLAWKFQAGQTRELGWSGQVKLGTLPPLEGWPSASYSFEMNGTLVTDTVSEDGSGTGTLNLHRQALKGQYNTSQMDLLVEDSILKKPAGVPPDDKEKQFLASVLAPCKVRMSRRGNLEFTVPHPLISKTAGAWALMTGPVLPWKKQVAVGDAWIGQLQTAEAKSAGEVPFDIEYTFSELTEINGRKGALITANSRQSRRMNGTDVAFTIKSKATFDLDRGECIHEELTTDLSGETPFRGQKHVTTGTMRMEFSVLPPKK
jgi:hypothetical protein